MSKFHVIGGVVLIFVLGILCGVAGTHFFYRSHLDSIISDRLSNKEGIIVSRLVKRLELAPAQEQQVKAIVHQTHSHVEMVRERLRPETEAIIEKGQAQIMTVLTPQQKAAYERMIAERKEKLRQKNR